MSVERVLKALDGVEPGAADIVMADALWDHFYPQYIEARDALIAKALDPQVVDAISKAVIRAYVAAEHRGEPGAVVAGQMLEEFGEAVEVAKSQQAIRREGGWVQYVNRDERGRFSRTSRGTKEGVDVQRYINEGRALPGALNAYREKGNRKNFSYKQMADERGTQTQDARLVSQGYLEDWMQTNNLVTELKGRLSRDTVNNTDLILHFADRERPSVKISNWADPKTKLEHDLNDGRIAEYEIVPKSGVEADKLPRINRELDAAQKMDLIGASSVTAEQMDRIMQVLEPTDLEATRVTRLATLLSGAGAAASAVGMRGTGMALNQAAAAAGLGEEFRPMLTRAAYRYRGTEKTRPDRAFVEAVALRPHSADDETLAGVLLDPKNANGALTGDAAREAIKEYEARRNGLSSEYVSAITPVVGQRLQMWRNDPQQRPATVDQLRMGAQRDLVAQEFVRRQTRSFAQRTKEGTLSTGTAGTGVKPLRKLIQEIANGIGRDLPSEGVVIGADGKVVTQAVGVGGDYYQPFNLKGRKALDGGQYVRTRQLGGLTTDDLRMLLNSNARAGTVVSASGVFDLEFDPEFRNQERFNDRALGMVDTYERILDQLAASKIYARDLDPDTEQKLRAQARQRAERTGATGKEADKILEQLIDAERKNASELQPGDIAALRDEAAKGGGSRSQIEERFQAALADKRKEKVRTLGLNAEGYEVALKTLQSYYPYFIRDVSRRDLGEFMTASVDRGDTKLAHQLAAAEGARDKQYVRPGAVRSGNTPQAGLGLPEPKQLPYDGRGGQAQPAEQTTKPVAPGPSGPVGGGTTPKPETKGEQKPPWDEGTAKAPLATATDVSPALSRATASVSSNAPQMYKAVPHLFTETDRSDIGMATQLLEESHPDEMAEYKEKAFDPRRTDVELADLRMMLDVVTAPDQVMSKAARWLAGDPQRYDNLKTRITNDPGPYSDDVRLGLHSMADIAMAVSLTQQGWRAPGSPFDGKPMALPQLRDADTEQDVWAGIAQLLQASEDGAQPFPQADDDDLILTKPAADSDTLARKLTALKDAHDIMRDARELDTWLETAKTADGRPLADMTPEQKAQNITLSRAAQQNWYALRTGTPSAFENATNDQVREMMASALAMDDVAAQDAWDSAEMYYTAANASVTMDAAQMAATGFSDSSSPESLPKVVASLGGAPEMATSVREEKKTDLLRGVLARQVFGKSSPSPRGVPVGHRGLAAKVQELVAKGMPPAAAAMRLRTTPGSTRYAPSSKG